MDISQPIGELLPKSKTVAGGLWRSLGLLSLALVIAALVGVAGTWVLRQVVPDAPLYYGLVFASVALVTVLRFIAARFEWIIPWYYLLPAIIFLLTFTFFPVVLTVILAFTDYAGIRNGELSISTETAISSVDGTALTLSNPATLGCDRLRGARQGCNDVRAVVYASGTFEAEGVSLDGERLVINPAPPEDRDISSVTLFLPSVGFAPQFPVSSVEGDTLILERTPPEGVAIDNVTLTLDRVPINRRILSLEGDALTLNEALPEGLEYIGVARYNDFGGVGLENFRIILQQAGRALLPVFVWNVAFAVLTILINTVVGVFLALLLNNPDLRFRNLYRTLLIVPWALPAVITIQVWRGFLNENFGAINRFLALLDMPTLDWLGDPTYAKAAVLLVNLWLGLPFMMTATLGALSAIPRELYEAARMDGANAWEGFWGVTAPLLRSALVPIALTGFAFNFNNFNLIFLLTGGGPPVGWGTSTARGTDILISWAYNEAFQSQGGYAYGLGAAISIIIFVITLGVSLINFQVTGALKEEQRV